MGGKILRRTEKNIKNRIEKAKGIIFFLDYDGTLTPIEKKPGLAKIGKAGKSTLQKLARKKRIKVFIVSGRILNDVKNLIGLKKLYYIGNHGIELDGPHLKYINPIAKMLRPFIQKAYKDLKKRLKIRGVILENKIYTLSVHYRLVNPSKINILKRIFKSAIRPLRKNRKIRITRGKKVFEVRPNIEWNKGSIVKWVLKRQKNSLPICIGDDITDEDAFRAIGKSGITILVSWKRKKTAAQYRLNSPKDVVKFLESILHIQSK